MGQKQTLSAQFPFIFAGPLLCSWSIKREEAETEGTHTFSPCSKYLPALVHSAGSYPVPHKGQPIIQTQEQDTEKANACLLSEPQTFFLNIQNFSPLSRLGALSNKTDLSGRTVRNLQQNTTPQMTNEGHLGKSLYQKHPS